MKPIIPWLSLLAVLQLTACSTFTDSIARSASDIATQNAVKAMRDVDLDRQVHVTLAGGSRLNPGRNAAPRPVQLCVYVVQTSDWRPAVQGDQTGCVTKERDVNIVGSSRLLLAPMQIQQTQMQVSGMRELWVVVDADFAQRSVDYAPLRMKIEGRGWVHLSAWVEGNALFDGRYPVPASALATPDNAPAPAQAAAPAPWYDTRPAPTVKKSSSKRREAANAELQSGGGRP